MEWNVLNRERFKGRMKAPVFELSSAISLLGKWDWNTRTITLSRALLDGERYAEVIEVLKHEMAHQFVHECLGVFDETAHGETYQRVCRDVGADARAAGPIVAATDGLLARVAKLLALAESANVFEAENAMVQAQRLIAKHNLTSLQDLSQTRSYASLRLGLPRGRVSEAERVVAKVLVSHFFVEAIWISSLRMADGVRGSVLEICGTPENVELAEYVHGFLHAAAERLWEGRSREARQAGDRKSAFCAGVVTGFAAKLQVESKRATAAGLVWVQDADLTDYFRKRHPRVRHVRYGGEARSGAYQDGVRAGAKLILHRGMRGQGAGNRLLPPKR